jgi:hypothetical protein
MKNILGVHGLMNESHPMYQTFFCSFLSAFLREEAISLNNKSLLVHHVQPNGFVIDKNDKR